VLIRRMSSENSLWSAHCIHGEVRKLAFEISQMTVSKYITRRPTDPDQGWKVFFHNHLDCTAWVDS